MNIAHIAFYANQVLEDVKSVHIDTLPVGFWSGLYEGRGDTSLVPDFLIEVSEKEKRHAKRKRKSKAIAELNDKFRKSVLRARQPPGQSHDDGWNSNTRKHGTNLYLPTGDEPTGFSDRE